MLCDNEKYIPYKFIENKNQFIADEDGKIQIFTIDESLKKDITDKFFEPTYKSESVYLSDIIPSIDSNRNNHEIWAIYQSGKKKIIYKQVW